MTNEQKSRYDTDRWFFRICWGIICIVGMLGLFGLDPLMLFKRETRIIVIGLLALAAGASWLKSTVRAVVIEEAGKVDPDSAERYVARLQKQQDQIEDDTYFDETVSDAERTKITERLTEEIRQACADAKPRPWYAPW